MDNKKEILVIFKTHLDIGFTDYAETVKDKYSQINLSQTRYAWEMSLKIQKHRLCGQPGRG